MSSNSNKANISAPSKDPYEVLGLQLGASDTEIAKAYRNLARTLHPDKLVSQQLSPTQLRSAASRFQEIQIARSFLLDVDHVDARHKYDTKLASEQVRRATDKAREVGMSERRKRMRDELQQYEAIQKEELTRKRRSDGMKSSHSQQSPPSTTSQQQTKKRQLAREGQQMREMYAANEVMKQQTERAHAVIRLQSRQIRLKWSRKKLKAANLPSPSEDSIATMLSESSVSGGSSSTRDDCGGNHTTTATSVVERVQMLGDLGNAALVTFYEERSCDSVVQYYRTSEFYRAVHVNKDKQQRLVDDRNNNNINGNHSSNIDLSTKKRDQEDVSEWKERLAREREELARQMEDDDGIDKDRRSGDGASISVQPTIAKNPSNPFPPSFPIELISKMNRNKHNPLDTLEQLENLLLKDFVTDNMLRQMKVTR